VTEPTLVFPDLSTYPALNLHLLAVHCNLAALSLDEDEAREQHHDEHFGPGGLRHHDATSLHYDLDKARAMLAEGVAEWGEQAQQMLDEYTARPAPDAIRSTVTERLTEAIAAAIEGEPAVMAEVPPTRVHRVVRCYAVPMAEKAAQAVLGTGLLTPVDDETPPPTRSGLIDALRVSLGRTDERDEQVIDALHRLGHLTLTPDPTPGA
jgi:hypothetical protein